MGKDIPPTPSAKSVDGLAALCPHCELTVTPRLRAEVHHAKAVTKRRCREVAAWQIVVVFCPACDGPFVLLNTATSVETARSTVCNDYTAQGIIFPRPLGRPRPPSEVPESYRVDFQEASLVLQDSPQSSAALSRRMLQAILVDPSGVAVPLLPDPKKDNLYKQIQRAKDLLPRWIWEDLDALRQIGNMAAHEQRDATMGVVVKADHDDAVFGLHVVEALFQHCFVQRAKSSAARDAVKQKLVAAGKPGAAKQIK